MKGRTPRQLFESNTFVGKKPTHVGNEVYCIHLSASFLIIFYPYIVPPLAASHLTKRVYHIFRLIVKRFLKIAAH